MLCDSLPQLKFWLLRMSPDPWFVGFPWSFFGKISLAAIVQHCKGGINKMGIFMFYLNWHHTHTDNISLDGCWCTCNFSSTISWLVFTALTAFCHWFFTLWLVSMQFCWMISLSHTANCSHQAVSSTIVLAYWLRNKVSGSSETSLSPTSIFL